MCLMITIQCRCDYVHDHSDYYRYRVSSTSLKSVVIFWSNNGKFKHCAKLAPVDRISCCNEYARLSGKRIANHIACFNSDHELVTFKTMRPDRQRLAFRPDERRMINIIAQPAYSISAIGGWRRLLIRIRPSVQRSSCCAECVSDERVRLPMSGRISGGLHAVIPERWRRAQ